VTVMERRIIAAYLPDSMLQGLEYNHGSRSAVNMVPGR
jgi:hypothetical protein